MSVPETVGVIGGGRMGSGIAHAFLLAGARVTILERDEDSAVAARANLGAAIEASVSRGTTTESADELAARGSSAWDAGALAGVSLVVEAVPEDLALKTAMLARVDGVVDESAWFASNTSSLSITAIGQALRHPERLCGMHFFNPVPSSSLVEIVRGDLTAPELIALAQGWVAAIGKTAVTVRDSPGFASSRLGVAIALEAIRMLEEGVASAEDIDTAMVLGYKFPVGPLRLTDMVGLDVRLGIAEYLHATLGERFAPPELLRSMVAAGDLGRKSGRGFFSWED
ncbi:3-hydroxyacyl-CoA dehydrogenase family protein [soil metagenome]